MSTQNESVPDELGLAEETGDEGARSTETWSDDAESEQAEWDHDRSVDEATWSDEEEDLDAAAPPADPRRYFPALDGLRCLAALGVSLAHVGTAYEPSLSLLSYGGAIIRPGLVLFFMISGFLVYRPFVHRNVRSVRRRLEPEVPVAPSGAKTSGWVYLLRRMLRIMPLYWAVLTIRMLIVPESKPESLADYLQVYLLLPLPDPSVLTEKGLGLPTWTLAIELPFYLLLPLYAAVVRWVTVALCRRLSVYTIEVACLGGFAVFAVFVATLTGATFEPAFTLLLGMTFAVLATKEEVSGSRLPRLQLSARLWIPALIAVGALWVVDAQIAVNSENAFDSYTRLHWLFWGTMASLLFIPAAFGPGSQGYNAFLSSRPMQWLAPFTYGFYLWHPVVLYFTKEWVGPQLFWLVYATLILSMACAMATYWTVERPMASLRAWIDQRFAGGGATVAPAVVPATAQQ